jgi:hypothetical protein
VPREQAFSRSADLDRILTPQIERLEIFRFPMQFLASRNR